MGKCGVNSFNQVNVFPVSSLNSEKQTTSRTGGRADLAGGRADLAGGRADSLPVAEDNPSASFIQTFVVGVTVGPSISATIAYLQPFDDVSTFQLALLAILQIILSLPIALVLAPLAAVCSVTVNSPSFSNRLITLYNTAVPSSVQEVRCGASEIVTIFFLPLILTLFRYSLHRRVRNRRSHPSYPTLRRSVSVVCS